MQRRSALKLMGGGAALITLGACATGGGSDIVDLALATPQLSTLAAAVQAGGLVDTLRGPGPFTVFAPTDAAFAALPAGALDSLLLPENQAQLANILTYHVVPGAVQSGDVLGQRLSVASVQGGMLDVNGIVGKYGSGVQVNGANVTQADIIASNGVIHIIDRVLLP